VNDGKGIQQANATTLVLAVLKDGERHGYDIAREVERRSENAIVFKHGTLYPILHGLEADNLIVSAWEHPDGERPRRVYSLTAAGETRLQQCLDQWSEFARAMDKVIGGQRGEQPI
jgi:DNA-binding PadR family transcriptional regulator